MPMQLFFEHTLTLSQVCTFASSILSSKGSSETCNQGTSGQQAVAAHPRLTCWSCFQEHFLCFTILCFSKLTLLSPRFTLEFFPAWVKNLVAQDQLGTGLAPIRNSPVTSLDGIGETWAKRKEKRLGPPEWGPFLWWGPLAVRNRVFPGLVLALANSYWLMTSTSWCSWGERLDSGCGGKAVLPVLNHCQWSVNQSLSQCCQAHLLLVILPFDLGEWQAYLATSLLEDEKWQAWVPLLCCLGLHKTP